MLRTHTNVAVSHLDTTFLSIELLVYGALAFGMVAFLLRDELRLRLLYICSLIL